MNVSPSTISAASTSKSGSAKGAAAKYKNLNPQEYATYLRVKEYIKTENKLKKDGKIGKLFAAGNDPNGYIHYSRKMVTAKDGTKKLGPWQLTATDATKLFGGKPTPKGGVTSGTLNSRAPLAAAWQQYVMTKYNANPNDPTVISRYFKTTSKGKYQVLIPSKKNTPEQYKEYLTVANSIAVPDYRAQRGQIIRVSPNSIYVPVAQAGNANGQLSLVPPGENSGWSQRLANNFNRFLGIGN